MAPRAAAGLTGPSTRTHQSVRARCARTPRAPVKSDVRRPHSGYASCADRDKHSRYSWTVFSTTTTTSAPVEPPGTIPSPSPKPNYSHVLTGDTLNNTFTVERLIRAIEHLRSDPLDPGRGVWYSTQKEHWLGWLGAYHGPGYYGRVAGQPRRDAKFAYNHIVNPQMLSWLIGAAGVNPVAVAGARRAASKVKTKALNQQAAAIRRHAPWETVMTALIRKERSRTARTRAA